MNNRRNYADYVMSYYWHDTFCEMYWNKVKREWQSRQTEECLYQVKEEAEEDKVYFLHSEDIKLRPYLPYALAA